MLGLARTILLLAALSNIASKTCSASTGYSCRAQRVSRRLAELLAERHPGTVPRTVGAPQRPAAMYPTEPPGGGPPAQLRPQRASSMGAADAVSPFIAALHTARTPARGGAAIPSDQPWGRSGSTVVPLQDSKDVPRSKSFTVSLSELTSTAAEKGAGKAEQRGGRSLSPLRRPKSAAQDLTPDDFVEAVRVGSAFL